MPACADDGQLIGTKVEGVETTGALEHEHAPAAAHYSPSGAAVAHQPHAEAHMPPRTDGSSGHGRTFPWARSGYVPGSRLTPTHIREHPGFKRNKLTLLSMGIAVVLVRGCGLFAVSPPVEGGGGVGRAGKGF